MRKYGSHAIYRDTVKNRLDVWISNNRVVQTIKTLYPPWRTLYTAEGSKIITLTKQQVAALLKAEGIAKLGWKAGERPQRTFTDAATGKLLTESWPDDGWTTEEMPRYPKGHLLHDLPVNEIGVLQKGEFYGFKVKPDGTFDTDSPMYKEKFESYDISPKDGEILGGFLKGNYFDAWGRVYTQDAQGRKTLDPNWRGLGPQLVDSNGVFRERSLHNWRISPDVRLLNGPLAGLRFRQPSGGGLNTFSLGRGDLTGTGYAKIYKNGYFSFKISEDSLTGPELASGKITYIPKESEYDTQHAYNFAMENIDDWNNRIDALVKQQKNTGALTWRKRDVLDAINTAEGAPASNNQTSVNDEHQQIQDYIAFYTVCQANVSSLIFPTLQNMLQYPDQSDLLRIAAASIYSDLTRSYMLISSPFWQGSALVNNATFLDNSTLVLQARAQNATWTDVQSMLAYNEKVVQLYLAAWARSMALLNQTTLLADMDRIAGFLNPADASLLPDDWTTIPEWDPNFDAFFPGGPNSTSL